MRDPRHDPRTGDKVYKGTLSRTVDYVIGHEVGYISQANKSSRCFIETWRSWCKGATLEPLPAATSEDQGLRIRFIELENRVKRLEDMIGSGFGIGIEQL